MLWNDKELEAPSPHPKFKIQNPKSVIPTPHRPGSAPPLRPSRLCGSTFPLFFLLAIYHPTRLPNPVLLAAAIGQLIA